MHRLASNGLFPFKMIGVARLHQIEDLCHLTKFIQESLWSLLAWLTLTAEADFRFVFVGLESTTKILFNCVSQREFPLPLQAYTNFIFPLNNVIFMEKNPQKTQNMLL